MRDVLCNKNDIDNFCLCFRKPCYWHMFTCRLLKPTAQHSKKTTAMRCSFIGIKCHGRILSLDKTSELSVLPSTDDIWRLSV